MGFAVASTVLAAASSYALTDLATAKVELSIDASDTSDEAWLTNAITQVSRGIARHCRRVFQPELVQDGFDIDQDPYPYQTPGGFAQLQLSRYPLLAVLSVVQTIALNTTQKLTEGVDFRVDAETGQLLRLNPFTGVGTTWEALPVTVVYLAGYGAMQAEQHSVPSGSPWQVTVAQAAIFSCDASVAYANGTALVRVGSDPTAGQYSVADGVYSFSDLDAGQSLAFTYATVAIPDDLVEIVLRLITARYKAKDRDPALVQQDTPGMGTRRWWFGGAPGQKGPYPPDIAGALEEFRAAVVI